MFEDLQDTRVNKRVRKKEDAELDITPMIDVTFLLLIFFIVASTMDPQFQVDMPSARHGSIVAERDAAVIVVARNEEGGEDPYIYLGLAKRDDRRVMGSEEEQAVAIAEYIAKELSGDNDEDTPKIAVLIKAESGIRFRHIDRVTKAASRSMPPEMRLHVGVQENR